VFMLDELIPTALSRIDGPSSKAVEAIDEYCWIDE